MGSIEHATVVAAPQEAVWEYISDPRNYLEWIDDLDTVIVLDDAEELGEGTRFRERGRIGYRRLVTDHRIVEWAPPRRAAHRADVLGGTSTVTLEATEVGENTYLRYVGEARVLSRVRPLGWLIEETALRSFVSPRMRRQLANVKAILEE